MKETNKVVLVITDGIGYNTSCNDNAFCNASKPTYKHLFKNVPNSLIKTSGLSVGLPVGQMGNSEVGHMTIGSGRVLFQNLVKISNSIKDGTLKENRVLKTLLNNSKNIHIVALLSDGGVHSHIDHIIALAKISSKNNKKTFLHLITDGRDVSPTSSPTYIKEIEKSLDENISIASISGRFYSMDRDNRWDRVEKGYRAIVEARNSKSCSVLEYVNEQHSNNITDEFIEPASFNYNGIKSGDGVIFANFRSDRMREITDAIANEKFDKFSKGTLNVNVITMTEYSKDFDYPVLFENRLPENTLASIISDAKLKQLHTSETEKYAHVTFFLNGGVEEPFLNETRVLVPSPDVKTYDLKPEMSAYEVGDNVVKAMKEEYDFIVVNFANGDMVGHTGDYNAALIAVESVDVQLGKILETAKEKNYSVVITSDHGNCELMKDKDGNRLTNHTLYDVFCFVMSDGVTEVKDGGLNNIAPTVLKLMNLDIPKEMDEPLV